MKRLLIVAVLLASTAVALGDGGRLQMRRAAGPFVVSLFTTPESLATGPADLSVLVEERRSSSVLLDADIVVRLTPQDGSAIAPVIAHLSHAHAANRLLQDSVIQLPHAGRWLAVVHVSQGGREGSASTELTVASYSVRRGTIALFLVLPVCAVVLFGWVQFAKRRVRHRRAMIPSSTMSA